MGRKALTQGALIMEFYRKNPNRDVPDAEVVDWLVAEYHKRTGRTFRDPDRGIRKLAQEGHLIKVGNGVYRFEPGSETARELQDFTQAQKEVIMKRDNYRCVICGRGPKEGWALQVDHIKPKDLGGKAEVENGETLCSQHNFQKKNYRQTESGKRYFIRLYEAAKMNKDKSMQDFCTQILEVYDKNGVNGHIAWKR